MMDRTTGMSDSNLKMMDRTAVMKDNGLKVMDRVISNSTTNEKSPTRAREAYNTLNAFFVTNNM